MNIDIRHNKKITENYSMAEKLMKSKYGMLWMTTAHQHDDGFTAVSK